MLQSKMHLHPTGVAQNLTWLKRELKKELADWSKPKTKRVRKPDYILFTTNVRLSPAPNGGKDSIKTFIQGEIQRHGLPIRDFRVWDYDDIRALLNDASSIRAAYAALLTTGDIISKLIDRINDEEKDFAHALATHAARSFRDDTYLKLSQTGTVRDQQITIGDTFVDLPLVGSPSYVPVTAAGEGVKGRGPRIQRNVVDELITRFDTSSGASSMETEKYRKSVLIGGPGQGKSTVTQFLAQIYRAKFLEGSQLENDPEIAPGLRAVQERALSIGLQGPKARRWPFRIILTDLADSLSNNTVTSLLDYMAKQMTEKASVSVSMVRMRRWLEEYPWVLILDGLDEVPNSSNRAQVLECIQNFQFEVKAVDGDVTIVATTRPQGYGEEFNPHIYSHLTLSSLSLTAALDYARGFITVRTGGDAAQTGAIYARLEKASSEESTKKLFTSPLQVTILTVLVETSGQVPRDRWRLFSQYYYVITQRELEKNSELSLLLRDFQGDVDYLHRFIGDVLQRRGAEAGETSATIDRHEFEQIIRERLEFVGHAREKVDLLLVEFMRLVTDRLVFLAVLQADKIGFEIRSLQEFMAGAYRASQPESEIVPSLTEIAPNPYWRNVFLFIVGHIFSDREHLRADIPLLCAELNDKGSMERITKLGSLLALEILLDGSAFSQPRYAAPLARTAAELLEGPVQDEVREFHRINDDVAGPILNRAVFDTAWGSPATWVNKIRALALMEPDLKVRQAHLAAILEKVDEPTLEVLVSLIGEEGNEDLVTILGDQVFKFCPSALVGEMSRSRIREVKQNLETVPAWQQRLHGLLDPPSVIATIRYGDGDDKTMKVGFTPVDESKEIWEYFSEIETDHSGWSLLRNLGSFASEPSSRSLSALLRSAAEAIPADRAFCESASWVVRACFEAAVQYYPTLGVSTAEDAFRLLAQAADEGELGEIDDWRAAESRWRSVDRNAITHIGPEANASRSNLPIWPSLRTSGITFFGFTTGYMHDGSDSLVDHLVDLSQIAEKMVSVMHKAHLIHDISFMLTLYSRGISGREKDIIDEGDDRWVRIFTYLERVVQELPAESPVWARWILSVSVRRRREQSFPEVLRALGGLRLEDAQLSLGSGDASWIKEGAIWMEGGWKRYRLAILLDPTIVNRLREDEVVFVEEGDESNLSNLFRTRLRMLKASSDELQSGFVDDIICGALRDDKNGGDVIDDLKRYLTGSNAMDLVQRFYEVGRIDFPFQTGRLLGTFVS
ncbi:hypothetical protein [Pseudarthrobacter sp. IC2-21]|uniref:NACHT domain-containing protein n=1 Tax=Pseudarthrobacter sp. IC2-21 TaxID=3092262 RepID=UPI002A6B21FE|nr:hypothetical protein [Pseudarthrobacter sp. IC2-21]